MESKEQLEHILDEIVSKRGISRRERNGKKQYAVIPPLLWGMFEHQLKRLTPEFLGNWGQYTQGEFGNELANTKVPYHDYVCVVTKTKELRPATVPTNY